MIQREIKIIENKKRWRKKLKKSQLQIEITLTTMMTSQNSIQLVEEEEERDKVGAIERIEREEDLVEEEGDISNLDSMTSQGIVAILKEEEEAMKDLLTKIMDTTTINKTLVEEETEIMTMLNSKIIISIKIMERTGIISTKISIIMVTLITMKTEPLFNLRISIINIISLKIVLKKIQISKTRCTTIMIILDREIIIANITTNSNNNLVTIITTKGKVIKIFIRTKEISTSREDISTNHQWETILEEREMTFSLETKVIKGMNFNREGVLIKEEISKEEEETLEVVSTMKFNKTEDIMMTILEMSKEIASHGISTRMIEDLEVIKTIKEEEEEAMIEEAEAVEEEALKHKEEVVE